MIEGESDTTTNQLHIKQEKNIPVGLPNNKLVSSVMFLVFASLAAYLHNSQREHPFKPYIDSTSYLRESNPKIYAGEVHYPRIPVEYWDHRIKMIKAMGLNTLSVYIFWNYHEVSRGVFDFETDNKNLSLFLELAEANDMKVLIRPGPYVCAEWDLGGLPGRLLGIQGLILRSREPQYLEEVQIYFQALAPIIRDHLWTTDHPDRCIIMLQIQNQYGFYGADMDYMMWIRNKWHELKIYTSEYYVDWFINIRKSYWPGANIGLNDAFTQFEVDWIHTSVDPKAMIFGGEIYSGWITFWHKDKLQKRAAEDKVKQYEFLMSHNLSYSMYMAHGGTNFGLTAGSNSAYMEKLAFSGQITSYDYDAPISEQGQATPKYKLFRETISKYATWQVPEIPEPIPLMTIPSFSPEVQGNLLANIDWQNPKAISDTPLYYQSDQLAMYKLGIVVYRTTLPPNFSSTFMIRIHDLGYIKIDGKFIKTIDRTLSKHNYVTLTCKSSSPCDLQIVTEAMGHINYDLSMQEDQKGLREFYNTEDKGQIFKWKMYTVPVDDSLFQWNQISTESELSNDLTLQKAIVTLSEAKDTYLDMRQFSKGYVWVNGHNLGRYWRVGPQFRLYCPGVWLKQGTNEIHVLDMLYDGRHSITGEMSLE